MIAVQRMPSGGIKHNISPKPGTITKPSGGAGRTYAAISCRSRVDSTKQKKLETTAAPDKTVKPKALPESFEPGPYDVICARGKAARDHAGNQQFRHMVDLRLERYKEASSKLKKTSIVSEVIDEINEKSSDLHGGFVRKCKDRWYEASDSLIREKIGQCFRDRLHDKYKSSSRTKFVARQKKMREEKSKVTSSPTKASEISSSNSGTTSSQTSSADVPTTILIPKTDSLEAQQNRKPAEKTILPACEKENSESHPIATNSRNVNIVRSKPRAVSRSSSESPRNDFSVPYEVYSRWEACLKNEKKQSEKDTISQETEQAEKDTIFRETNQETARSFDEERGVPTLEEEEEELCRITWTGESTVHVPGQKTIIAGISMVNQLTGGERLTVSPCCIQDEMLMTESIGSYDEDDIPMEISSREA